MSIVLIGGGSGIAEVLQELKFAQVKITAIVSVFDSGGSTGILRKKLNIPAIGDLRKNFSLTSKAKNQELFEFRHKIHPLGNLVLAFLVKKFGLQKAVRIYSSILENKIKILPVSFQSADLIGEFTNGKILRGEKNFDHPSKKFKQQKIQSVYLEPRVKLNPEVKKVLASAQKVIVGPGSIFGSLLANFAVTGFTEEIQKSLAKKIFIQCAAPEFGTPKNPEKLFPIKFDEIFIPSKKVLRWNAKILARKILA
jgi:uncharacterized cofD-like protein